MGPNTFQPHAPGFQTGMYPPHSIMMMSPQGQPMGTHMVITTQSSLFGDVPIQCICSHCHQPIVTRVEQQTGLIAWLICAAILLLGGWLGCCLIPFCIDSLKVSRRRNRSKCLVLLIRTLNITVPTVQYYLVHDAECNSFHPINSASNILIKKTTNTYQ